MSCEQWIFELLCLRSHLNSKAYQNKIHRNQQCNVFDDQHEIQLKLIEITNLICQRTNLNKTSHHNFKWNRKKPVRLKCCSIEKSSNWMFRIQLECFNFNFAKIVQSIRSIIPWPGNVFFWIFKNYDIKSAIESEKSIWIGRWVSTWPVYIGHSINSTCFCRRNHIYNDPIFCSYG